MALMLRSHQTFYLSTALDLMALRKLKFVVGDLSPHQKNDDVLS
jgi:hypothetical protein